LGLEKTGCCGAGSKLEEVKAKGEKALGYEFFLEALKCIDSNDRQLHNSAVDRVQL
jgi:hypothetical protein